MAATGFRLVITQVIHILLFALISWQMFTNHHEYTQKTNDSQTFAFYAGCVFTGIGGILQFVACCGEEFNFKYCNLSNLLFIVSSIVQYGMALHYSHLTAHSEEEASGQYNRTECVTLERSGKYGTFIILLITLPGLIVTNMLYPLPEDKDTSYSTILNGFAMLDIIDMAELMFVDVGCYQTYGVAWMSFFYLALGVSAILTVFSYGLEQRKEYYSRGDFYVTISNLVFNDLLFFILRVNTMAKQGHVYFGLIFVVKEFLSFCFRVALLCVKADD